MSLAFLLKAKLFYGSSRISVRIDFLSLFGVNLKRARQRLGIAEPNLQTLPH